MLGGAFSGKQWADPLTDPGVSAQAHLICVCESPKDLLGIFYLI